MTKLEMIEEIAWMTKQMGGEASEVIQGLNDLPFDEVQTQYDFISDDYVLFMDGE